MTEVLLDADGVTKTFRRGGERVAALRSVTFSLDVGQLVALVGPSGSGKTTLLNALAGFDVPDTGRLVWQPDGTPPAALGWHDLAVIPQRLGLFEELTIGENVGLPPRLAASGDGSGRVADLLDRLGLAAVADRRPGETSLGEQQRAALARALVRRPRLVLADEPTGHQDAAWGLRIFQLLRDAALHDGTTSLVATHSREFLADADRILRLHDGALVAGEHAGPPA